MFLPTSQPYPHQIHIDFCSAIAVTRAWQLKLTVTISILTHYLDNKFCLPTKHLFKRHRQPFRDTLYALVADAIVSQVQRLQRRVPRVTIPKCGGFSLGPASKKKILGFFGRECIHIIYQNHEVMSFNFSTLWTTWGMPRWINSRSEIIYSSVLNKNTGPHGPVSKKRKINSQRCLSFKSNQLCFCHVFFTIHIFPLYNSPHTPTLQHDNKHWLTCTVNSMGHWFFPPQIICLERAPAINVQPASPRLVQASGYWPSTAWSCARVQLWKIIAMKCWFAFVQGTKRWKLIQNMKTYENCVTYWISGASNNVLKCDEAGFSSLKKELCQCWCKKPNWAPASIGAPAKHAQAFKACFLGSGKWWSHVPCSW